MASLLLGKPHWFKRASVGPLLLGWLSVAWGAGLVIPLRVEDALRARSFAQYTPLAVSPDGESVAYSLVDESRRQGANRTGSARFTLTGVHYFGIGSDVWLRSVGSENSSNLTGGAGNSWAPSWSPDGRYLAFHSDSDGMNRVWIWDSKTRQKRRLPDVVAVTYNNP
ncbi:MAG: TolB family protein, partial [Bryobacteraceae bacterium]